MFKVGDLVTPKDRLKMKGFHGQVGLIIAKKPSLSGETELCVIRWVISQLGLRASSWDVTFYETDLVSWDGH